MRKLIVDTDTASDDAVALMMALRSKDVEVMAVTIVAGNMTVAQAAKNALMTIEVAGAQKPRVYLGCTRPLFKKPLTAEAAHGGDGMGDLDLIHPTTQPEQTHAVDEILRIVKENPGEIEIVTLGPATNIAVAIFKDPETMKQVKHIYSMGTAGFGPGNSTPVSEYNVFADAESYLAMLESGIPITIAGFDICLGDAALNEEDIEQMRNSDSPVVRFAVNCNRCIMALNQRRFKQNIIDFPDPVAMAVALCPEIVTEAVSAYCRVSIHDEPAYGQVVIEPEGFSGAGKATDFKVNATVVKRIDGKLFKERMLALLQ